MVAEGRVKLRAIQVALPAAEKWAVEAKAKESSKTGPVTPKQSTPPSRQSTTCWLARSYTEVVGSSSNTICSQMLKASSATASGSGVKSRLSSVPSSGVAPIRQPWLVGNQRQWINRGFQWRSLHFHAGSGKQGQQPKGRTDIAKPGASSGVEAPTLHVLTGRVLDRRDGGGKGSARPHGGIQTHRRGPDAFRR